MARPSPPSASGSSANSSISSKTPPQYSMSLAKHPSILMGGPLARVPSMPTELPGPIIAINLQDLAAAIHPDYTVAELTEALLRASEGTPVVSDSPESSELGAGDFLRRPLGGKSWQTEKERRQEGLSLEPDEEDPFRDVGEADASTARESDLAATLDAEKRTLFIRSSAGEQVPQGAKELAGSWNDFPDHERLRSERTSPTGGAEESVTGGMVLSRQSSACDCQGGSSQDRRSHVRRDYGSLGSLAFCDSPRTPRAITPRAIIPKCVEKPTPRSRGSVFNSAPHNSFKDDESTSERLRSSLGLLAASLTSVPGAMLETPNQRENAEEPCAKSTVCESSKLLETSVPVEPAAAPSFQVPDSERATMQRKDVADVIVALPQTAAEAISRDSEATALIMPMPQKEQSSRAQPHLLVVPEAAPSLKPFEIDSEDTAVSNKARFIKIESELRVCEANNAGTGDAQDLSLNVKYQVGALGYAILFVSVVAVASQGPAMQYLSSVKGALLACWLSQCQGFLVLPLCWYEIVRMSRKERWALWATLQDRSTIHLIAAVSATRVMWSLGFFFASDYTSMFQAWQLNNIHAVIIVGLALLAGQNISDAEVCGSCMALVGIVMMHAPAILGQGMGIVAGNSIALFGSCGAVMFLDLAGRLRERLPLFVMMVPVSFLNSFLFSVVAVLFESANYSVSDRGAFGWMSPHRILFGLYLGGVVGILGSVSSIAALSHLPSVVVSIAQALTPSVGTAVVVLLGLEAAPSCIVIAAGLCLLGGVLLIAIASSSREIVVNLNKPTSAKCA